MSAFDKSPKSHCNDYQGSTLLDNLITYSNAMLALAILKDKTAVTDYTMPNGKSLDLSGILTIPLIPKDRY